MINWPRFVEVVCTHQRFVLTSHIRPDCDALGSELAMAGILQRLDKEVLICNAFAVPRNLRFLDHQHKFKQLGVSASAEEIERYDVLMVLDTTAWAQLGVMADVVRATKTKKIVLDHHVSEDDLGAEVFKDVDAEATGRLVIDAADQLGVAVDAQIARAAFAAVATDTGWFRFSSTSGGTLRLAARLVEAGADPATIYHDLYEVETLARLRLIGRTMARTQSELDGRLIYTWIEREDFDATGAVPSDSEDVVNMAFAVGGTEAAFILVEQVGGGFKVSLRSRDDQVDCSRLAELFGGGGHRRAAGAFLREPLETARAKVLDAVRAAMQPQNS